MSAYGKKGTNKAWWNKKTVGQKNRWREMVRDSEPVDETIGKTPERDHKKHLGYF